MSPAIVASILLAILGSSLLENARAEETNGQNTVTVIQSMEALSKVVENLKTEIQMQASLLNNLVTIFFNHLPTKSDMQIQENSLKNLEAKYQVRENSLINLEAKVDELKIFMTTLNVKEEEQVVSLRKLELQSEKHVALISEVEVNLEYQTSLVYNLMAKVQMQAELLNQSKAEHQHQGKNLANLEAKEERQQSVVQSMTNRTIIALAGDDVEIRCVHDGTPLSQIKWKKENGTLKLDRVQYGHHAKVLIIHNVERTDAGTYLCDAADGVETAFSHPINLEVYESEATDRYYEPRRICKNIQIRCLLIKLENTTGFRLELHPLMAAPILVIPEQNPSNYKFQSIRIYGYKNVSHEFKGKSLAIVVPPGLQRTILNWTGLGLDNSGVTSSTEFKNDIEGILEWEPTLEGTHKIFWAFERQVTDQLNWTLNTGDLASDPEHPCGIISLAVLEVSLDGNVSEIEKTCEDASMGSLMSERGSQVLILLHMKSVKEARANLAVTWGNHGLPFKKTVDGILVGTEGSGDVVIPFNSTQTRPISSDKVYGLAFDWSSRRIYKSQYGVGIVRSNLNGSESETLLSDPSSSLFGIAIEPISGNFYYGNRTSRTIRVCSNDATKCTTIANSSDLSVRDLAIHWSKRLLFWSVFNKQIARSNLDGSNAEIILEGLNVRGIDVDEQDDRLYWGGSKEGIQSCDLNGRDIRMLPNLRGLLIDVAIHGERVYYSAESGHNVHVTSKLGTNGSLVANLTNYPYNIALFGTRGSIRPPNPCKISPCAHLCVVMSPSSFKCMCQENQRLNTDGRTCQLK